MTMRHPGPQHQPDGKTTRHADGKLIGWLADDKATELAGITMTEGRADARLVDRRILVVEDAYFIADDIAAALCGAGAIVVGPASRGPTALALLASEEVDAAVLDINLHGDAVYPVADMLIARGTPFVFASGYATASIPAAYRDIKLWEKPFDSRALVGTLADLLGKAAAAG